MSYILKTANTWRGPIRDFTLRLRKSSLEESLSLCFPGQFKKVDALTLEAKMADFAPAADLPDTLSGNRKPGRAPALCGSRCGPLRWRRTPGTAD